MRSLTAALGPVMPILEGFRAYAPEVVAGFFEGFGGSEGGYYDSNGHDVRVQPVLSGTATGLHGALTLLGDLSGMLGATQGPAHGNSRPVPWRRRAAGDRRRQSVDGPEHPAGHLQPGRRLQMRRVAAITLLAIGLATLTLLISGGAARGSSSSTIDVIFDDARGLVAGPGL